MKQNTIQAIQLLIKTLFKNSKGDPYIATVGQAEIFWTITDPYFEWLWISAPTRYGKSEILSMALLYLATYKHLKIPIVGGSEEKANKIMEYILQHISDHPSFSRGLINLDVAKIEKLKVQVSKQALRWSTGGWIYTTSVDARSLSKEGEKVVGEGGDIVVLEEAGLIRDKAQYSKVVRMTEGEYSKMIMSGNCIEKSVFETAYRDPLYHKVRIDLEQAIAEGRYTREKLAQKKTQTTSKDWKRYYEVLFPEANEFSYFKPKTYKQLPQHDSMTYYGAIDPALGKSEKGDLVGIVVLGKEKETGQVYEVYNSGIIMAPDEAIKTIFNLPYTFERFGVEAVMFQHFFFTIIEEKSKQEGRYIPFEAVQQSRNKEARIESLEPYINTGQILFSGSGELWTELQDYPKSDYDDVLDSLEITWKLLQTGVTDFFFADDN